MKKRSVRSSVALAVGILCVGLALPVRAEVSTDPLPRHRSRTLMMDFTFTSITDGADPIPSVSWQTYRPLPAGRQLNKSGASRPDGRPDLVYRPPVAAPLVVWAYNNGGGEHDIAFAAWDRTNDVWGRTQFLTNSAFANEVDPRVFYAPDGVIHVVWSVQAVDGLADSRIMLATLRPGEPDINGDVQSVWTSPVRVSPVGEQVARPTVAESHGFIWIAYERIPNNASTTPSQIVVRRRPAVDAVGSYNEARVLPATRLGPLNPLLTAMHGRLWLDWALAPAHFGYVTLRSTDLDWTTTRTVPWLNPSWLGVEDVRQTIRRQALAPNASAVDPQDTGQ